MTLIETPASQMLPQGEANLQASPGSLGALPLGSTTHGQTVAWRPAGLPLLVQGRVGAGKSMMVTSLVYAALLRNWRVIYSDDTKDGMDQHWAQASGMESVVGLEAMVTALGALVNELLEQSTTQTANSAPLMLVLNHFTFISGTPGSVDPVVGRLCNEAVELTAAIIAIAADVGVHVVIEANSIRYRGDNDSATHADQFREMNVDRSLRRLGTRFDVVNLSYKTPPFIHHEDPWPASMTTADIPGVDFWAYQIPCNPSDPDGCLSEDLRTWRQ